MSKSKNIIKQAKLGKHHIEVLTNLERNYNRLIQKIETIKDNYPQEGDETIDREYTVLMAKKRGLEMEIELHKDLVVKKYLKIAKLSKGSLIDEND